MGMRHIKNTSPHRIPVVISVIKPDGNVLTVDLKHGESILVNDTGAATKSVIIQVKKRNITMSDEFPEGMTPYEKCILKEKNIEPINEVYFENETFISTMYEEPIATDTVVVSAEEVTQQAAAQFQSQFETQPPVKKAGRPKGSTKKKRGRPKGSTKKRKLRKLKALEKEQKNQTHTEQLETNTE